MDNSGTSGRMSSGSIELDGEKACFRPAVPIMPRLEDVQDLLQRAIGSVGEFDRLLAARSKDGAIGRLFARLDAVHSAGAEGATTTFTELMEFETSERRAPDPADAAAVAACAEALEAEPEADLAGTARKLHHKLFERSPKPREKISAGRWKDRPNATQDSSMPNGIFYYTRPASVPEAMAEWQEFTTTTGPSSPEILRQIVSHWMFEHIHPFHDGNGRVGRLLVPLTLKLKGANRCACAFLGEAVFENKDVYIGALKEARTTSDWTSYGRTMLAFVAQTAESNIDRLRQLDQIETAWKAKLRRFRKDARLHVLAQFALTNPVFTVDDAKRYTGGTYANNNLAVAKLVEVGILDAPGDKKRGRIFRAEEVLDAFDRFRGPHPYPSP
jgi:Fic family protein